MPDKQEMICQDCGRASPPCGFYPMAIYSGSRTGEPTTNFRSPWLCHDCEKERRARRQAELKGGQR